MKKIKALFLAFIMMISMVFISESITSGGPFSVQARSGQVTVKRRKRGGIARRTYRGGRYVVRRTWDGTKWVSRKVWVGTKWTSKKTWKGGRKVISRTKKIVY